MSFDINWNNIYTDPNINNSFKDFLNSKLSTIELPNYLANLQVVDFKLGPESPELSIRDIDLPFPEFYQKEEDKKASDEENKNEELGSGNSTNVNSPTRSTIPIIPLPTPTSSRQSPIPNYFNKHIHSPQTHSDFLSRSPSPHPFLPKRTSTPMTLQSPKASGLLLPRTNSGFIPTVGHIGVGLGGFGVVGGDNNLNISDNYSYKENYNENYNESHKKTTRREYLDESIDCGSDRNMDNIVKEKKEEDSDGNKAKFFESQLEDSDEEAAIEINERQEKEELSEADGNNGGGIEIEKEKKEIKAEEGVETEEVEEEKEGKEIVEGKEKKGREEKDKDKEEQEKEEEEKDKEELEESDANVANKKIVESMNVQEKKAKAVEEKNDEEKEKGEEEDKREKEFDIQLSMEIKWNSKIYIEVSCDLLVNYPAPEFIRLPVRLKITDLKILSLMIIAYISQKVFISFLCDINDEIGQNDNYANKEDSKKLSMGEIGMNEIRRDKDMERIDVIKDIKIEGELGNWDGDGEGVEAGTGSRNEPWKEIEFKGIQNEGTVEDGNGLVLRNIGKIEKFLVTAFRGLLISELAWPSWIELDFNEEDNDKNEENEENEAKSKKENKV